MSCTRTKQGLHTFKRPPLGLGEEEEHVDAGRDVERAKDQERPPLQFLERRRGVVVCHVSMLLSCWG